VLRVSNDTAQLFKSQLMQDNIPVNHCIYFHKWQRYYLDFCSKKKFAG